MSNSVRLRVSYAGKFVNQHNEVNYINGYVHDGIEIEIVEFHVKKRSYEEVRKTINLSFPFEIWFKEKGVK